MNFVESAAKPLLAEAGIPVPRSYVVNTMAGVEQAAKLLGGPCVIKAQVPTGGRGKAGGIKLANNVVAAKKHAERILGMTIGGYKVERLLIEETVPIAAEMYAAVLNDPVSKSPLLLFSGKGGMDVEEIAAKHPGALMRLPVDILKGPNEADILAALPANLPINPRVAATLLMRLYDIYRKHDAELLEVNPLVLTRPGGLAALDCKFVLDDSAVPRREALAAKGAPEQRTALEVKAEALGLKFIELDGNVGVLANGAGLTMTTMDAIRHYGGAPANFLEIGGESYTKAKPGLELVLANPSVKALLVNFCGAFARTDVMTEGVIAAWQELAPKIPVFFTIHGTGEDEAIALVRSRLGIEPYDVMDDAVKAAVAAATRS
jgi:succinyl-CoA synthetase beta subunit